MGIFRQAANTKVFMKLEDSDDEKELLEGI